MKKKRLLWLSFGVSLAVFLLTAVSSQIVSGLPPSLSPSQVAAPSDDHTLELLHYQTNPTPTSVRDPTATPPTQGGHGKDIFYVHCMPCHGDQGQGLTDEFRNRQYPPEDVNCWKSGCHGERPYENGFKLPKTVPVLVGAGALQKFATAQNVYDFMRAAMPFNKPGSLSQEQYLQLLAFLLEQNRLVPAGAQLDADTLQNIALRPVATPTVIASPAASDNSAFLLLGVVIFLGVAVILYWVTRSRSSPSSR